MKLEKVIKNISTAQGKQKQMYDRKHARPCEFKVRKYIVIYNMPCIVILAGWDPSCQKGIRRKKRKGGKMDAKWLGPFLLSSKLGKGLYSLASLDGKRVVVKRINGAYMKVYKRSSSQEPSPSISTPQSPKQLSESG